MDEDAYVALLLVHLHFPDAGSLKAKRKDLASVKAQLHGRMGVTVAEVGHQNLWQRATLAAALTGGSIGVLERSVDRVERFLLERFPESCRVERAVVLAEHETVLPEDLPEHIRIRELGTVTAESRADLPMKRAKDEWNRTFEREYLRSLLARHAGNISQAARAAGVDRKTIHRLLKKHHLDAS